MQVDLRILLAALVLALGLIQLAQACGGGGGGGMGGGGGGQGGGGGGQGGGGGGGGDDGGDSMRARRRFVNRNRNVRRPAVRNNNVRNAAAKPRPAIVNHVHISLNQEQKKNSGNGALTTTTKTSAGKPDPQMLINNQLPESMMAAKSSGCTGSECPMPAVRSVAPQPQYSYAPQPMPSPVYPQYMAPPAGYPQIAMPYQPAAAASAAASSAESQYEPEFAPVNAYNPYAGNARSPDYYAYGQRGPMQAQPQPQPAYRWS